VNDAIRGTIGLVGMFSSSPGATLLGFAEVEVQGGAGPSKTQTGCRISRKLEEVIFSSPYDDKSEGIKREYGAEFA